MFHVFDSFPLKWFVTVAMLNQDLMGCGKMLIPSPPALHEIKVISDRSIIRGGVQRQRTFLKFSSLQR